MAAVAVNVLLSQVFPSTLQHRSTPVTARNTALVIAALALSACSSDPATPADSGTTPTDTGAVDSGGPVDSGSVTDAGNRTDTGPADAGTVDAGPPSCTREGGEYCFELPTAAVRANTSGGPVDPDFNCDLPAVTTTAAALTISGTVGDFVTGDSVSGATVDVFSDLEYLAAPLASATSDATGAYTLMVPSGTRGPLSWRVRAPGTLDTYLVNDTVNLAGAGPITRSNRNSVDNGTASLLATLLGQSRRMGTGIIAGNALDCQRRDLIGAIATISSTSSRMTNNRPTFVPSAQIYYFSPTPQLPARRTAFSSTSSNGLYLALQLPPPATATTTYYAQVWGFRTTAAVAMGAAGLSLLSEVPVRVPADVLITVNHEPLRMP